jgi:hypothetical protein
MSMSPHPTKTQTVELTRRIVTQGLAGAGSALVQLVPLVLHYVKKWFLGRTPRQAYGVTFMMPAVGHGNLLAVLIVKCRSGRLWRPPPAPFLACHDHICL